MANALTFPTREPHQAFRLSMLLNDSRYRSYTIQIFVLMCLMLGIAWLVDNTVRNLALLGKDFSFSFLWSTAGYDINQRLIEYDTQMTHGRAALVGLLNTVVLAVLSCVLATIIGVMAGVLRLSGNPIVARLTTVYVEVFRNIPLLLWILVFGAIMSEAVPAPNAFKGASATASMIFGAVAITNRGVFIPEPLFARDLGTLNLGIFQPSLNAVAVLVVVITCILVNRALMRHASRVQSQTGVRPVTWWTSAMILAAPPLLLLWAFGFHLGYPELRGFNFQGGLQLRNSLIAMWLGLSIYTGAFIAENVRAGILAISKGQTEAAYALGLRPGKTMRLVILPQALRVLVPPLISQYLNITKNTSLGLAVGYMDLRSTLGGITINQTGRELEGMLLLMLVYLSLSLIISGSMNVYNARVGLKER
ncbi:MULTISPECIES: ABC transporter permease subunit [unclassified Sinorhizobium]|uniref:amino acid ABC transporter permease n=1 Tax=unclassified Sinorhizobium TaxID=2613772 RepID=UPI0024C4586F|nr:MULTISPECIES: ABC transporter permease subunit [unclassified Sinorhizobium]MDK1376522.1 ABC transporter permease subunit [Sinorhizobium sp. 6-70]MDK1482120.1 ABC transporter permease subunit [Sinorhizobium sp. 6-117]